MDLEDIRREYLQGGLQSKDLAISPIQQFSQWMEQALAMKIGDPTAMTLATVSADGQPSQRIVLLKHFDEKGFVFYTNYNSRKAQELGDNDKVSLHFPWHAIERQVKICGTAVRISTTESMKYFLSRPRESQIAAWASPQSETLSGKDLLMNQFASMKQKFAQGEIPLPDFWGGYRVEAMEVEFWQGGEHRLHDRFRYRLQDAGEWAIDRLAP